MTDEWKPAQRDIEVAASLLKGKLPQALDVASKRPDVKDLYAASALVTLVYHCLPVLPPDVAALARQHWQLIQDAYHVEEERHSPIRE